MLFLAWVWARAGVVGDGLVSIGTHNNPGICFQSARVLVGCLCWTQRRFCCPCWSGWGFGPGGCWICVLGGGVRLLGLVREGMSVVVCSDFSLLVRLVGWTCRATLTHAWSGAPDLVNKVEPKLR